ncbi:MAG: HD-GYP domain-containing protein [Dehalococcoidia bacterium]|nr:HD-GYP domain-containing protein [Dehalococcoidia bacterium]
MRYATRTFLLSFLPFALLLLASFWAVQGLTVSAARAGFRETLRQSQELLVRLHARGEQATRRSLKVLAENPALKAGLQLALVEAGSAAARRTVADQLREINENLGLDLLLAIAADGSPLAGVRRAGAVTVGFDRAPEKRFAPGLGSVGGEWYRLALIPVNLSQENLGALVVGERLDLREFPMPVALEHHGRVIASNLAGVTPAEVEQALQGCAAGACEVRLKGIRYFSVPLATPEFGEGFRLRGLADLEAATAPILGILRRVFVGAGAAAMLAALAVSLVASRSVTRPLSEIIAHLRTAELTGELAEFSSGRWRIREVRQLAESFNRAAAAVREGREQLRRAYLEFIGSLVSALDARDPYTAGHSHRVSEWSRRLAEAMGLDSHQCEAVRVGALLHDIGKIGVPDSVLRKPGPLTLEERRAMEEHPVMGAAITAAVTDLDSVVNLVRHHHERFDGEGYPGRLKGAEVPLATRLFTLADAYSAMTTDRPYRKGLTLEMAVEEILRGRGTQFDPELAEAFVAMIERTAQGKTEQAA